MLIKKNTKKIYSIKVIHITLLVILNLFTGATLATAKPYGLYTSEQINKARELVKKGAEPQTSAYLKLMKLANSALNKTHHAVASLKSYQWYTATAAQKEEMNRQQHYLSEDANNAHELALAYRFTGETKYAEKAAYFINAWARINKEYIGVGFKGDSSSNWKTPYYYNQTNADLIMVTSGAPLIQAAILIKDYTGWSSTDQEVFSRWCTNVFRKNSDTLLQNKDFLINNTGISARQSIILHHVWQGNTSALINEDIPMVKKMLNLQLQTLTDAGYNIPDMLPHEVRRGNQGMWYTAWALAAFTNAMEIIQNHTGVNLFRWENINGSNVEKALDRFFIYAQKPNSWPWLDKSGNTNGHVTKIPQPGSWGGTLYEAMGIKFNKETWKKWAGGPTVWFTTQLNWQLPSLIQPNNINTNIVPVTENPTTPKKESSIPTIKPSQEEEIGAFIMDRSGLH